MIFVPLTMFSFFALVFVAVWFARSHELNHWAHRLFLVLIVLYALQSLLITFRWGYGIEGIAPFVALTAPVLPMVAFLSYTALSEPLRGLRLWPVLAIALCWVALFILPSVADALILMVYLGFGGLLIARAWRGSEATALSPLGNTRQIMVAMGITGGTLVASGLTDIYVIYDFIQNEGRRVGRVVSILQSVFVMAIGVCAAFGRVSSNEATEDVSPPDPETQPTEEDAEIITRIEAMFAQDGLHRSEELSLRRLSRRLSLPDRRVSNAINRSRGQSVSQFVNDYRIKDACHLLSATGDTILTISLAVGFATKSNFNREFARVTGVSPSQWRKAKARA